MKNIKYKVWDKILKCWSRNTHGFLHSNGVLTFDCGDRYEFVQWTGLCDKAGMDIYEWDIVELQDETYITPYVVRWLVGCWECHTENDGYGNPNTVCLQDWVGYIKVIGSIYENPELLQRNKN